VTSESGNPPSDGPIKIPVRHRRTNPVDTAASPLRAGPTRRQR
jgi:hypothetical protein